MNLFSGSSFFGMRGGSRRPSHKPRALGAQVAVTVSDAEAKNVDRNTIEFAPKASEASTTEDPRWLKRGLFKVGFNAASPRLRGARKFTK